jgi:hypothetical protein
MLFWNLEKKQNYKLENKEVRCKILAEAYGLVMLSADKNKLALLFALEKWKSVKEAARQNKAHY